MRTAYRIIPHVVRFDRYEADLDSGELRKQGTRIRLREQSFQVLAALLERPGEVVTREELRQRLWGGDVFVDFETNLNSVVAHLREVLNDSAERPRFIETSPRRGYRFISEVRAAAPPVTTSKMSRPRMLVLPFVNLSGDPGQEYFSDAMTDEVITTLASLAPERLAVIARTTAMHYKASHKDVGRIGRELGVDYVVEGALRRDNDHVAINVQLIQTNDQVHLYSHRYESHLRDIFGAHRSIAQDIVAHLAAPGICPSVHTLADSRKNPTENPTAYNEYIKGRYLQGRLTPDAAAGARQHFEKAIRLDPDFALAHMAMAEMFSAIGYLGWGRPKEAYAVGITYARRAVELDDTLAEAHAELAAYHKQLDYNWAAAEREMARALELSRTSVRGHNALHILMPQNRIAEALAEFEGALESDPLNPVTRLWVGLMCLLDVQYDRAIDVARDMLELEPNSPWPPFVRGIAYRAKYERGVADRTVEPVILADFAEQSIAAHLKAVELAPGTDYFRGWLGLAFGVCGRTAEARAVLEQVRRSDRYNLPTTFGHIHLGLGELDAAFEWFDRAVEERDQNMMPILSYGHWDPIRNDPRFADLLRKMNLRVSRD